MSESLARIGDRIESERRAHDARVSQVMSREFTPEESKALLSNSINVPFLLSFIQSEGKDDQALLRLKEAVTLDAKPIRFLPSWTLGKLFDMGRDTITTAIDVSANREPSIQFVADSMPSKAAIHPGRAYARGSLCA